jgi:ribonuclease HI
MCTDCSKIADSVAAAGIILVNDKLVNLIMCKLHGHCTNNQAEQIAIFKRLKKGE